MREAQYRDIVGVLDRLASDVLVPKFLGGVSAAEMPALDLAMDRLISNAISTRDPASRILSEESTPGESTVIGPNDALWVVDPVDGSKNFSQANPHWGIMVARVSRQSSCAYLSVPMLGARFVIDAATSAPLPPLEVPVGSSSTKRLQQFVEGCLPTTGSCAADFARLFRGEVGWIGFEHLRPWDHWPGVIAARGLGFVDSVSDGSTYCSAAGQRGLIVARPPLCASELAATYYAPFG